MSLSISAAVDVASEVFASFVFVPTMGAPLLSCALIPFFRSAAVMSSPVRSSFTSVPSITLLNYSAIIFVS